MIFSSMTFLFMFLPALLVLYFLNKNIKFRNVLLIIFSLIFYSWGEPKYIVLMLFTTFIVYVFGLLIDKNRDNNKSKVYLVVSISICLLSLFIFKYLNFTISILNYIFSFNIKAIKVVLPIGISFYTFQIISYIVDLFRNKVSVQKNPFKLLLYISFFPQLIAGPIVRYKTIEEEINNRIITKLSFIEGFKRFLFGLGKKVIIANNVAMFCDYIYGNLSTYVGSSVLWLAAIAYSIQIYFDFSGYSDMAIGLGKMFGFNFLENFNYPYICDSITDFWRRWHISLSTFFRDYVYIPLGGNRVKKIINIRNIVIVWLLTGLWHGANINYVLWGIYYCIFLLIEKFIIGDKIKKVPTFLRHLISLIIVIVGWTIFRLENFSSLIYVLKNMFIYKKTDWFLLFKSNIKLAVSIPYLLLGVIMSLPIDKLFHKKVVSSKKIYMTVLEDFILGVIFIITVLRLVSNNYNPFIYFRF